MEEEERPRATVDRYEEAEDGTRLAVLVFDDGQQLVLPAATLPEGVAEGTVVTISLTPEAGETEARMDEIEKLQRQLFGEQG